MAGRQVFQRLLPVGERGQLAGTRLPAPSPRRSPRVARCSAEIASAVQVSPPPPVTMVSRLPQISFRPSLMAASSSWATQQVL